MRNLVQLVEFSSKMSKCEVLRQPVVAKPHPFSLLSWLLILCVLVVITGCGNAQSPTPPDGEALVKQTLIGTSPGCATCHSLAPGVQIVGPSLAGAATRATEIILDPAYTGNATDAAGYLRESIVTPNAYVPGNFVPGTMYQKYGTELSPEQIQAMTDFLLTLK
jgi:cytochrome c2